MSETVQAPQLSGQMFLFKNPELISKEQHGDLGFTQPARRYAFCETVRAVPLTVSEIPAAMKDYPVVFASTDQMIPVAVVGLIDDENLFVGEDGEWEPHRYIPGYIRRYPFGVASETGGDRIAIVIDRGFEGFSETGELKLFGEDGQPTDNTQQAIEFCRGYEQDRIRTNEFGERVKNLNVVSGQSAQFTPQGGSEPMTFAEYLGIDENALKNLDGQKLVELRDANILPILYGMVMSLGNFRPLLQRRAARHQLTDNEILKQMKPRTGNAQGNGQDNGQGGGLIA